jgi:hypothetical protein
MKRVLAFAPIPAVFLAGAGAARLLVRAAPARIAPDRAQPLLVVTAWGPFGSLAFAVLAATIALAAVALVLAIARVGPPGARGVAGVCALALAACAFWPFLFSSDVYAYAAYGDLAARGMTPYALAPPNLHDVLLDATRWQWGGQHFPPCVYGPAFVLFARAIVSAASAAGWSAETTLAIFRICAMLALVATVACANVALQPLEATRRARILTLGALNPVVLWSAAEGHNDIYALLVVAAVAAGVRIAQTPRNSTRVVVTCALFPFAMLVKASAGLLAFASVLDALLVERRRALPIVSAALAGLVATLAIGLPPLVPALHALAVRGRYAPAVSVAQLIGGPGALACGAIFATIAIVLFARRSRAGYGWLGLAAVVLLPNPYPWYATVLVVLALVDERARASRALYAVTICAVIRYLPDAFGDMSPSMAALASAVQFVPIAFALSGLRADLAAKYAAAGPPSPSVRF